MDNSNNGGDNNATPGSYPSYPNQGGYDQPAGAYNQGGYDQPAGAYNQGGYGAYPNADQANQYGFDASQGNIGVGVQQPGGELPTTTQVTAGAPGIDIGQAVSYAFKGFKRGPGAWIGFMVIFAVIMMILSGINQALTGDFNAPVSPDASMYSVEDSSISLVIGIVSAVFSVFFIRAALEIMDGRALSFGDFFKVNNWGSIVLTLLLEWAINTVIIVTVAGLFAWAALSDQIVLAAIIGVVGVVLWFAIIPLYYFLMHIVIDQRLNPIDALKQNVAVAKNNYFSIIGLAIVSALLQFVGFILCFVGLIYFYPVSLMVGAHGYRQCIGGRRPVA